MKIKRVFYMIAAALAVVGGVIGLSSCGSNDEVIKIYTRDTTSGTRDGFFTGIGLSSAKEDNTPLKKGYIEVDSNGDMISAIKNDKNGIGYISLSSLEDSGLKGLVYEGVEPTEANVLNSSYALLNAQACLVHPGVLSLG